MGCYRVSVPDLGEAEVVRAEAYDALAARERVLRDALEEFDRYASDGLPLPNGYAGSPFQKRVAALLDREEENERG